MTRTGLLQLTIVILLICAGIMGLLWWSIQKADLKLNELNATLMSKQEELANLAQMTESQDKLDKLTLDERETTQLALLRHLNLESVELNFQVLSREARPSGDTTLITRSINLQKVNSYPEQMALLDELYQNGKLQLNKVSMRRAESGDMMDPVDMAVEGVIYSLEKTQVADTALVEVVGDNPAAPPAPEAQQEGAAQ